VHVKLLRQLGQSFLAFERRQGYLRLERKVCLRRGRRVMVSPVGGYIGRGQAEKPLSPVFGLSEPFLSSCEDFFPSLNNVRGPALLNARHSVELRVKCFDDPFRWRPWDGLRTGSF
jgi:hypothetical protein